MLEPMVQRVVHWSQRGLVKGRQMAANVVHVEAVVDEYLNDEDAEPAVVFLDIAAAFPSAEWAYMQWALGRIQVPVSLIDAIFRLYASACVRSMWEGTVSDRSLPGIRGIPQGGLASGALWALLYDTFIRRAWHVVPRGGGIGAVFADDGDAVLRNIFRDFEGNKAT